VKRDPDGTPQALLSLLRPPAIRVAHGITSEYGCWIRKLSNSIRFNSVTARNRHGPPRKSLFMAAISHGTPNNFSRRGIAVRPLYACFFPRNSVSDTSMGRRLSGEISDFLCQVSHPPYEAARSGEMKRTRGR